MKKLPTLKYVNHLGEIIDFNTKNYFTNSYIMRDYVWNYDSDFYKIKNFNTVGVGSKTLSVSIYASSQKEAFELFNFLFEVFEKDVLAQIPGKFYIGDYYFAGYVISSSKKEFLSSQNLLSLDLTVISDTNTWVREVTYSFSKNQLISGHGYVYKYPYRYSSGALKMLFNEALTNSDFNLIIYGSTSNPELYIGGHRYLVDVPIESKEYLEINSREKTLELIQSDGTRTSALKFRNRDSYIFQKIPTGTVSISWNNDFGFDLTIYDERSEPLWI